MAIKIQEQKEQELADLNQRKLEQEQANLLKETQNNTQIQPVAQFVNQPSQSEPIYTPPAPVQEIIPNNSEKYISGSCTELTKKGIGNFLRGSVNYSKDRDRDNDGIACELK